MAALVWAMSWGRRAAAARAVTAGASPRAHHDTCAAGPDAHTERSTAQHDENIWEHVTYSLRVYTVYHRSIEITVLKINIILVCATKYLKMRRLIIFEQNISISCAKLFFKFVLLFHFIYRNINTAFPLSQVITTENGLLQP